MPTYFRQSMPSAREPWGNMDQAKDRSVSPVNRMSVHPRHPSSDGARPLPSRASSTSTSAAVEVNSASRNGASASTHSPGAMYVTAQKATSAPNASESMALPPPSFPPPSMPVPLIRPLDPETTGGGKHERCQLPPSPIKHLRR